MKMEYTAKNIQDVRSIIKEYREIYEDMKGEAYKAGVALIRERDSSNPITRGELAKATGLPNNKWRVNPWGTFNDSTFNYYASNADFRIKATYVRKPIKHYAEVDENGNLVPGGKTYTLSARCGALYNGSR